MTVQEAIHDKFRVDYYRGYLENLCKAISEGVQVKTYFAWSFMDNFEWREGYSQRFGINYVDFKSPALTRTTKDSGRFLAKYFFKVGQPGVPATAGCADGNVVKKHRKAHKNQQQQQQHNGQQG
eukprot:GHUV01040156.1.p1 GENE.GHUV01040156.1~~GHUV01040156.1.p1  ORF type:complete len:124 (+),score=39.65 GHUV01040156.1:291-662(+)